VAIRTIRLLQTAKLEIQAATGARVPSAHGTNSLAAGFSRMPGSFTFIVNRTQFSRRPGKC